MIAEKSEYISSAATTVATVLTDPMEARRLLLREEYRIREASRSKRMKELEDIAGKVDKMTADLAEKDAALADRDAALADRDAALADRDAALADRDAALADRDAKISALEAELAALKGK